MDASSSTVHGGIMLTSPSKGRGYRATERRESQGRSAGIVREGSVPAFRGGKSVFRTLKEEEKHRSAGPFKFVLTEPKHQGPVPLLVSVVTYHFFLSITIMTKAPHRRKKEKGGKFEACLHIAAAIPLVASKSSLYHTRYRRHAIPCHHRNHYS
jgi:hypothetical protein